MNNIDWLDELYKIQQKLLVELSDLDDLQKIENYLRRQGTGINPEIYKKSSLNNFETLLGEKEDQKLVHTLFAISQLLLKLLDFNQEESFAPPWITFVILNPAYHNNEDKKKPKYLFYTFGIANDQNPNSWYQYLDQSQKDSVDEPNRGFTISNLIFEKIDKELIKSKSIFRILYRQPCEQVISTSDIELNNFNDIRISTDLRSINDINIEEIITVNTINVNLRNNITEHIKALKKSIEKSEDKIYSGLRNYLTNINQYMGLERSQEWTLYGFPILSFLTSFLAHDAPHSGVYILSEPDRIPYKLTKDIHALLIATLHPLDQLFLIYELKSKIEYARKLDRISHHMNIISKNVKPLQVITKEVESMSAILDPNFWNPGLSDYKSLQMEMEFIFRSVKHDISYHQCIDEFTAVLDKYEVTINKTNFIQEISSSSLIEDKVSKAMFNPWRLDVIQKDRGDERYWNNAIRLAKCISKQDYLPAYWISIASSEDGNYESHRELNNFNLHEYYFKVNESNSSLLIPCILGKNSVRGTSIEKNRENDYWRSIPTINNFYYETGR